MPHLYHVATIANVTIFFLKFVLKVPSGSQGGVVTGHRNGWEPPPRPLFPLLASEFLRDFCSVSADCENNDAGRFVCDASRCVECVDDGDCQARVARLRNVANKSLEDGEGGGDGVCVCVSHLRNAMFLDSFTCNVEGRTFDLFFFRDLSFWQHCSNRATDATSASRATSAAA